MRKKGKAPYKKNWQEKQTISRFEDFGINERQNAGILTGDETNLIVVDVDNYLIFNEKYSLPETLTVKTGKGFHFYFRIPKEYPKRVLKNRSIGTDGFDIRANNGQVVAPFSIHATTGNRYVIVDESIPIAEAPTWVLDLSKGTNSDICLSTIEKSEFFVEDIPEVSVPQNYQQLLNSNEEGQDRSAKLWILLNLMIFDGWSNEDIISAIHHNPQGNIGEKYHEKGANKYNWLFDQVEKGRLEIESLKQMPIQKVIREVWVQDILLLIKQTFMQDYGLEVTQRHSDVLEAMIRLYVGILEGTVTGWYCIPLNVGLGKTQVILHLIWYLFLKREVLKDESIVIATQRIEQLDEMADFLNKKGVSPDFFSIIHHKVKDYQTAREQANQKRIVLLTHQRLTSVSFTNQFFTYKDTRRKLLVYDEQMSNATTAHEEIDSIINEIGNLERKHSVEPKNIPDNIINYFKGVRSELENKHSLLTTNRLRSIPVRLPVEELADFEYWQLLKYGDEIGNMMRVSEEATNWYKALLSLGKTEEQEKELCIFKEFDKKNGNVVMFSAREMLSTEITNLVTTDATREGNRLFKFTSRKDLKKVKIYQLEDCRTYEHLSIHTCNLRSGQGHIMNVFNGAYKWNSNDYPWDSENIYIDLLTEVFKREYSKESKMLIFHSKDLGDRVRDKLYIKLQTEGFFNNPEEFKDSIKFCTFGKHDATSMFARHSMMLSAKSSIP